MKTEKQIKEMAAEIYKYSIPETAKMFSIQDYCGGYTQAQKDLLAEASEGFEEWQKEALKILKYTGTIRGRLEAWQASRLPLMKKIEELERNLKDMDGIYSGLGAALEKRRDENEKLQKENRELRGSSCDLDYEWNLHHENDKVEKLQKENEELREALDYTCRGLGFYTDFRGDEGKKLSSIITKFSLDKNDKESSHE